jgi:hypothetical protein
MEEDRTYDYFVQDGPTAYTANYSINVLNKMFEDSPISHRLWPTRTLNLNPCDFYLWGNLTKCSQIISTHCMNLSTTYVKQLYLLGSVNSSPYPCL